MTTRSNAYIQAELDLIYKNTDFAGIGDASGVRGSATAGNLYVALFTDTVEIAYTGYARQAIPRSASGWSRIANVVTNVSDLLFTLCPVGTTVQSATKVRIYTDASAGTLLHEVTLVSPIAIQAAQRPVVEAGSITITGS
jgi:hypothetical protein